MRPIPPESASPLPGPAPKAAAVQADARLVGSTLPPAAQRFSPAGTMPEDTLTVSGAIEADIEVDGIPPVRASTRRDGVAASRATH